MSTAVFEGPFDLLLHLVTKEQVDIWELSLSSIVDEYLATIEGMQALDLSVATEFLLTAAVLLELKARRLLRALRATARRNWRCGRKGTCSWPACSSAKRSRTPRSPLPGLWRAPTSRCPVERAWKSASWAWPPICWKV